MENPKCRFLLTKIVENLILKIFLDIFFWSPTHLYFLNLQPKLVFFVAVFLGKKVPKIYKLKNQSILGQSKLTLLQWE